MNELIKVIMSKVLKVTEKVSNNINEIWSPFVKKRNLHIRGIKNSSNIFEKASHISERSPSKGKKIYIHDLRIKKFNDVTWYTGFQTIVLVNSVIENFSDFPRKIRIRLTSCTNEIIEEMIPIFIKHKTIFKSIGFKNCFVSFNTRLEDKSGITQNCGIYNSKEEIFEILQQELQRFSGMLFEDFPLKKHFIFIEKIKNITIEDIKNPVEILRIVRRLEKIKGEDLLQSFEFFDELQN